MQVICKYYDAILYKRLRSLQTFLFCGGPGTGLSCLLTGIQPVTTPPQSLSLLQHQLQSLKCQTPSKCHLSLIRVRSEVLFHGEFYFELSGRYNFEVLCLHRCWGVEFWSVCSPLYCQNPSLNNLLFLAYFKLCFLKRPVLGQARWLSGLRYLVPSLTG